MCDARIRPFRPINETEVSCAVEDTDHEIDPDHHRGEIKDYAYPGSVTTINWYQDDRRNFHGEWPGICQTAVFDNVVCLLPRNHEGNHSV